MEIKITVLMSVYNVKDEYLTESIDSILKQTYKNFEYIIFDDNTCKSNKQILTQYKEQDSRIKIITNKTNKGLTYCLNKGIELAKGQFICRQDADDTSMPTRFEEQLLYMYTHPDVAVLGTEYYKLTNRLRKGEKISNNQRNIRTRLMFSNCIMHSSVMMRNDFLKKNSINYNLYYKKAQDFELWSRIIDIGKIHVIKKRLCIYRIHNNQISKNNTFGKSQNMYFLEIAVNELLKIFEKPSKFERICHERLLLSKTEDIVATLGWGMRILLKKKDNTRFNSLYFNYLVLERMCKIIIKRILHK